ncbi:hypothetical protein ONZ43_g4099 [Nemania bipapillata]|uniref:Uncharacterized protein n=1 Tax=Nemania bipapillata TaxID=110536 RepID=A0ACC2IRU6_9PEZI|nr:hypothetical protein ONZ43_g4099 [Nemania bipapillata]
MRDVGEEKHSSSKEEELEEKTQTTYPQDIPQMRDSTEVEKTHNHDTDTDVEDTSSVSSSWEEDREQGSRPASNRLSRHISETEVRDGFQNQRDPELAPEPIEKVDTTAPNPNDPNLVTWTGPDDPQNPKNWTFSKKWAAVFTVSLFTLISPISSSLVAPALEKIAEELDITQDFEKNLTLSIFILAYAIGPLVYVVIPNLVLRVVEFESNPD